jgi:hypothetical protein
MTSFNAIVTAITNALGGATLVALLALTTAAPLIKMF